MEIAYLEDMVEMYGEEINNLYTKYIESFKNQNGNYHFTYTKQEILNLIGYLLDKCAQPIGIEKKSIIVTFMYSFMINNKEFFTRNERFKLATLEKASEILAEDYIITDQNLKCKHVLNAFIREFS
jgi:hypothetical protein